MIEIKNNEIEIFIPGAALGDSKNSFPDSTLHDKLRFAVQRWLSNNSFTEGEIDPKTPRLFISNHIFDREEMGYHVVARIL